MIRPIEPWVLLQMETAKETETKGGIVLPDVAQEKLQIATVKAVWSGCERATAGDRVFFVKFADVVVKHEGETLSLIKDKDLMAVVE